MHLSLSKRKKFNESTDYETMQLVTTFIIFHVIKTRFVKSATKLPLITSV